MSYLSLVVCVLFAAFTSTGKLYLCVMNKNLHLMHTSTCVQYVTFMVGDYFVAYL